MKIQNTESQVWWIALPDEIRPVRGLDGSTLAARIQSLFGFPTPATEIKGGGIEFLNGRLADFDGDILISKLAAFNDGLNINVPTNTSDAKKVLEASLASLFELGVRRPISGALQFYQSTIIADFEAPLENIFPKSLLKKVSAAMPIAGESSLLSIGTNFDATVITDPRWRGINPTVFRIDRRASMPYDLNRYFCLANMESDAHIEILLEMEKFAASAKR